MPGEISRSYESPDEGPLYPDWQYDPKQLLHGGEAAVPPSVAVCPECGGPLHARSTLWDTENGRPLAHGLEIECEREGEMLDDLEYGEDDGEYTYSDVAHRYWNNDWQPVVAAVTEWSGAIR